MGGRGRRSSYGKIKELHLVFFLSAALQYYRGCHRDGKGKKKNALYWPTVVSNCTQAVCVHYSMPPDGTYLEIIVFLMMPSLQAHAHAASQKKCVLDRHPDLAPICLWTRRFVLQGVPCVCMCLRTCVCICMYAYMYMCVYIRNMYIYVCACVYLCV